MNPLDTDREERVDAVVADYLDRIDRGEQVDRETLLARHPDLADELSTYFEAAELVDRMAGPTLAEHASVIASQDTSKPGGIEATIGRSGTQGDEARAEPLPKVLGRYTIEKPLGQGAMGSVYLARDTMLNRQVALKIPRFCEGEEEALMDRFHREAQAAATLRNPHICPVYDFGQIEGVHYITMAYIEGTPLSRFIGSGRLSQRDIAALLHKLALALNETHAQGVVHRDLKPSNIMIDAAGEPVIMDFGLARRADAENVRATQSGTLLGSPAYMSPEQVAAVPEAIGPPTDIYSLGVVLYELLTGRLPFEGNMMSVIAQIVSTPPRRPSALNAAVDPRLEAICLKMMAKRPEERYASMSAVAKELGGVLDQLSQAPLAPAQAERYAATPDREPQAGPGDWFLRAGVAVLGAGLAALAVTLGAVIIYMQLGRTTLKFEILDPALSVRFGDQSIHVDNDGETIAITPGREHKFTIEQNGLAVETDSFTLKRGQKVVLRVTRVDGQVAVIPSDPAVRLPRTARPHAAAPREHVNEVASTSVREIAAEARRFEGHSRRVHCVAVSPDGRWIASGGADRALRLWNAETGAQFRALMGHEDVIHCVVFSRDGRHVLSGSKDKTVRLWDLETGEETQRFEGHDHPVHAVDLSPDGTLAVSGSADWIERKASTIRLWDVKTGREVKRIENIRPVTAIAFSPDGQTALAGYSGATPHPVGLWDLQTGKEILQLADNFQTAQSVVFSPDGRWAISGHAGFHQGKVVDDPARCVLRVFDVETGREIRQLVGHTGSINGLAASSDGRYLVSGSGGQWEAEAQYVPARDNTVRLWDLKTGRELCRFLPGGHVGSVAISPDGRFVLSTGNENFFRLWEVPADLPSPTAKPLAELTEVRRLEDGHARLVLSVAISPDGRSLVSAGQNEAVFLSDLETGKAVKTFAGHQLGVHQVVFSPDGTVLSCSDDHTARRWDVETGQEIRRYEGHTGWVYAVAVSPDGKHLVTGSCWYAHEHQGIPQDNSLRLWDLDTGKEIHRFEGVLFPIKDVAFSPDGKSIVAGGENRMLGIWDVESGKLVRRFLPADNVMCVAFSTDGSQVASGQISTIGRDSQPIDLILWDVASGRVVRRLPGHADINGIGVSAIAFSPDGRLLASGRGARFTTEGWVNADDTTVRIWDVATGDERARADVGTPAHALAFTPDGRHIVSGGGRHIVTGGGVPGSPGEADLRLWELPEEIVERIANPPNVEKLTETRAFAGHQRYITRVAWLPDSQRCVSASDDGTLCFWDIDSGEPSRELDVGKPLIGLAVSASGKRAAVGINDPPRAHIELWDLEKDERVATLQGHTERPVVLAFSEDEKRLMSAAFDGTLRIWDVEAQSAVRQFKISNPDAASLSSDGRLAAARDPEHFFTVRVWNTETGELAQSLDTGPAGWLLRTEFSADGKRLATGSIAGEIQVWDLADGKELLRFKAHDGPCYHLQPSPDGQHLVTSGADLKLRLWDLASGALLAEAQGTTQRFKRLALSPDGRHVITGGGWEWNQAQRRMETDGDNDVHLYRLPQSARESL